jgi:CheY-like chemotaxis protein
MQGISIAGHSVLIIEGEPVIALDMRFAFEKAGASVILVYSLPDAAHHVEHGLSGAVLDYGLGSQDGDTLCHHLRRRLIPFILHSGYEHTSNARHGEIVIPKPARPEALIEALLQALCKPRSSTTKYEQRCMPVSDASISCRWVGLQSRRPYLSILRMQHG